MIEQGRRAGRGGQETYGGPACGGEASAGWAGSWASLGQTRVWPEQPFCLPGQCSYVHSKVAEITQPFLWLKGLGGIGVELHSGEGLAT